MSSPEPPHPRDLHRRRNPRPASPASRRRPSAAAPRPTVAVVGAADAARHAGHRAARRAGGRGRGRQGASRWTPSAGTAQHATWRIGPLDSPDVADRLRGVDVVVLLAAPDRPGRGARPCPPTSRRDAGGPPRAGRRHGHRRGRRARLVAVTSAMVLGAAADNPVPLPDDAPVAAVPDYGHRRRPARGRAGAGPGAPHAPGVSRHRAAPGRAGRARRRHHRVPALRGAPAAGAAGQHDRAGSSATWPTWPTPSSPPSSPELDGALTVGSEGWLAQEDVERLSGMRRVELPASLAFGTAERLHRVGVLPAPASDLAFVVHPWAVSSSRAAGGRLGADVRQRDLPGRAARGGPRAPCRGRRGGWTARTPRWVPPAPRWPWSAPRRIVRRRRGRRS